MGQNSGTLFGEYFSGTEKARQKNWMPLVFGVKNITSTTEVLSPTPLRARTLDEHIFCKTLRFSENACKKTIER